MALKDKYAAIINEANASMVKNLQVKEQNNVLYIEGEAPNGEVKDKLWNLYNQIDPDYRSADLVMNINVSQAAPTTRLKVTTESTNLNIRKGPGTDQPVIGKVAHNDEVTLISRYNDNWFLIRSKDGTE